MKIHIGDIFNMYYTGLFFIILCVIILIISFYENLKNKGKYSTPTLAVIFGLIGFFLYSNSKDIDNRIKAGEYFTNNCKALELNINIGFLKSDTNRLYCNDTIVNVNSSEYDDAIKAYLDNKK
ncbi:hypothetical protein [Xenorhabdus bovienii]|uniref:hypothetical protein n=1 Tax=Xenorhabdus bovienii TaxID=40576 RepID=UPI0021586059|nr:hypothetical protein [Xenorhabdus bovienii]